MVNEQSEVVVTGAYVDAIKFFSSLLLEAKKIKASVITIVRKRESVSLCLNSGAGAQEFGLPKDAAWGSGHDFYKIIRSYFEKMTGLGSTASGFRLAKYQAEIVGVKTVFSVTVIPSLGGEVIILARTR